ncbi:hypothetical protein UFOVP73_30 [uncultured Caudovirales phage]|uniref:Uncharacterized protein n=1 Tax=uncultured Caudovirales phage TaxID=2100421 RepID=A0A6J5KXY8_9CAUD|nr:hypothetical protein UFOVP73_30 [uncultured Caudovirales phage]CAB5195143.1 hypothetical protein UFOVP170_52 [uncultured Caudovirales phage]
MTTYRDRTRDQRVADDFHGASELNCGAQGCPNRWSIDAGDGRLCTAHSQAAPHHWGRVTQEQQSLETERAWRAERSPAPVPPVSKAEKVRILSSMRHILPKTDKGWAHALKAREEGGEYITAAQRDMWRAALGAHA